jgi:hypothetical protein
MDLLGLVIKGRSEAQPYEIGSYQRLEEIISVSIF